MTESVISGDPFGPIKKPQQRVTPSPGEVARFHERADTDSSATAQHHTLGVKHDQASPGDHKHEGVGSLRLMEGVTIIGSRGGNVALGDLIAKLSNALGFTDATTP